MKRAIFALAVFLLVISVFGNAVSTSSNSKMSSSSFPVPSYFEKNLGQFGSDVRFVSVSKARTAYFRDDGVLLGRVLLGWAGRDAVLSGSKPLATRIHRYSAQSRVANIPTFEEVRYESIYKGVDLIFYHRAGDLEFDIVVHPGAQTEQIALKFSGADKVSLDDGGRLELAVGSDSINLSAPTIFEEDNRGQRKSVSGEYFLRPDGAVGFRVRSRDNTARLIIDPVVRYANLVSGSGTEFGGMTTDRDGNLYLLGTTDFNGFPVGSPATGFKGYDDLVLLKFSPTGSLIYATYIGGSQNDRAVGIGVDANGNVYVAADTFSSDFPVSDGALNYPGRGAIVKLSPAGTLVYSAMTGADFPRAFTVDANGNAFLTGKDLGSNKMPIVNPSPLSVRGKGGYLQCISPSGSAFEYSTFLGIGGGTAIDVDASGNIYLAAEGGQIGTLNSFWPKLDSALGISMPFVAKLTSDLHVVYATNWDAYQINAITADASGNTYVLSTSNSNWVPLTANAQQTSCTPTEDRICRAGTGVLSKVSPNGDQLLFSSLLGPVAPRGIAVDAAGAMYVVATTYDSSLPVVGGVQGDYQGNGDIYFEKLDSSGKTVMSSYFGGIHTEEDGRAQIRIDASGAIYMAGESGTTDTIADFPLVQTQPFGYATASLFAAKIDPDDVAGLSISPRYGPVIHIRNVGSRETNITAVQASSNFKVRHNCGALAAGGLCTVVLSAGVDNSGSLTVISSGGTTTVPILPAILSGYAPRAKVVVNPNYVEFAPVTVGGAAQQRVVEIQNLGDDVSLNFGAEFSSSTNNLSLTHNCPTSFYPGQSCFATYTYSPVAADYTYGAILGVRDGIERVYPAARGFAPSPTVQVLPSSLYFQRQVGSPVGFPYIVTVTNYGDSSAPVSSTITGKFTRTSNCGAVLAAHSSCRIFVDYVPTTNETTQGTLTVVSSSTQSVLLAGSGRISADLSLSSYSMEFYAYEGFVPWTLQLTATNDSLSPLTIGTVTMPPYFTQTNDCNRALSSGESCTFSITGQSTTIGTFTGTMRIEHSGAGSAQEVALKEVIRPTFEFTTSSVDFGAQPVDTTSAEVRVTVTTKLTETLRSVSVTGDFTMTNSCPGELQKDWGCSIQVRFAPKSSGTKTGSVVVVTASRPAGYVLPLTGTGMAPGISVAPSTLTFGSIAMGGKSSSKAVLVTNIGTEPLTISPSLNNGEFELQNSCGAIAAGASCTLNVKFTPKNIGGRSAVLSFGLGMPTVALNGEGTDFTMSRDAGFDTTIAAGETAKWHFLISGMPPPTELITFTCSGAPGSSSCSVTPSSMTISGTTPASVEVSMTTTARMTASLRHSNQLPYFALASVFVCGFCTLVFGRANARVLALLVVTFLFSVSCGGGGGGTSSSRPPVTSGTPAGTYAVVVTATTDSGAIRSVDLRLNVR